MTRRVNIAVSVCLAVFSVTAVADEFEIGLESDAPTVITDPSGDLSVGPQDEPQLAPDASLIPSGGDDGGAANGGPVLYVVFSGNTQVPGVGAVANEDIVRYNVNKDTWSLVFDGSVYGLAPHAIDGFAIHPISGDYYLSFRDPGAINGLLGGPSGTSVDDSDVVIFAPATQTFTFFFDGSDIGLSANSENIDALAFSAAGNLLISTVGNFSATAAMGHDEDLYEFLATSTGAMTAGVLSLYFDGTDVQLTTNEEDVDAAAVGPDGRIFLSTVSKFFVSGIPGGDSDILAFTPAALGSVTIGTYAVFLDSSEIGINPNANISSIEIVFP